MRICLAAYSLRYVCGGAYLWVFLNWALGLRDLGAEVIWLDSVCEGTPDHEVAERVAMLKQRLNTFDLSSKLCVIENTGKYLDGYSSYRWEDVCACDLLINLGYDMSDAVVRCFRRSMFVDIDPGLTQIWLDRGHLRIAEHHTYFTYGENVPFGNPLIPDCGIPWHYTPPPVHLESWLNRQDTSSARFTTVSNWWGFNDWIEIGDTLIDNSKRSAFLAMINLPDKVSSLLELAIPLTEAEDVTGDIPLLRSHGWSIRHVLEVSNSASSYRSYVHASRGEFSCLKRAYSLLQTAWTSERTLNYLASGRPCVIQHTGPSSFLPDNSGLFRFRSLEEAADCFSSIERDYQQQQRAARRLAEQFFDASLVIPAVIDVALV